MKKSNILLIGFLSVIFATCDKHSGPIIIAPPPVVPISYANEIQPIFNANCVSCHDDAHFALNLQPCCSWDQLWTGGLNAPYVNTANPSLSKLHKRIIGTELPAMPPGGPQLLQSDIDKIYRWIEEGAINN